MLLGFELVFSYSNSVGVSGLVDADLSIWKVHLCSLLHSLSSIHVLNHLLYKGSLLIFKHAEQEDENAGNHGADRSNQDVEPVDHGSAAEA